MKKVFTVTILSLMVILTIVNSCSKSSDSSSNTTPTPTPPKTTVAGVDSVIVDGGTPTELTCVNCLTGSAGIFTMTFADPVSNATYLVATFSTQPATAGNYHIKFTPPAATTDVQIKISQNGLNGNYYIAQPPQTADTASVSFVNNKIQLSFSNISFIHGSTTKVVSATILCN